MRVNSDSNGWQLWVFGIACAVCLGEIMEAVEIGVHEEDAPAAHGGVVAPITVPITDPVVLCS
jgi:hypothetical protein